MEKTPISILIILLSIVIMHHHMPETPLKALFITLNIL
jgi:hypothetical protein